MVPTINLYIIYISAWILVLGLFFRVYLKVNKNKFSETKAIPLILNIFIVCSVLILVIFSIASLKNEYFFRSVGYYVGDIPMMGEYTYTVFCSGFIIFFNIILIFLLGKKSNVKQVILALLLPNYSLIYYFFLRVSIDMTFMLLRSSIGNVFMSAMHLVYCISVLVNLVSTIMSIKYIFEKTKDEQEDKISSTQNTKLIILASVILIFLTGLLLISDPVYQPTYETALPVDMVIR